MISAESEEEPRFGFPATPTGVAYLGFAVAAVALAVGWTTGTPLVGGVPLLAGVGLAVAAHVGLRSTGLRGYVATGGLLGLACLAAAAAWGLGQWWATPPANALGALTVASAAAAPYLVEELDLDGFTALSKTVDTAVVVAFVLAALAYAFSEDPAFLLSLLLLPSATAWWVAAWFGAAAVAVAAAAPLGSLHVYGYYGRYAEGVGLLERHERLRVEERVEGYRSPAVWAAGLGVMAAVALAATASPVPFPRVLAAAAWLPASFTVTALGLTWLLNSTLAGDGERAGRATASAAVYLTLLAGVAVAGFLVPGMPVAGDLGSVAPVFYDAFYASLPFAVSLLLLRGFAAVGVVSGPREWAGVCVASLLAAVVLASQEEVYLPVFAGVAASVVAWDVAENTVGHAEAGGWSWRPARSESLHLVLGVGVAAVGVGVAYLGYRLLGLTPETPTRPLAAVLAAAGVVALVWTVVRTR